MNGAAAKWAVVLEKIIVAQRGRPPSDNWRIVLPKRQERKKLLLLPIFGCRLSVAKTG
jgi:hypothetical protein